ncbi:MAG: type II toxin-antitoxin system prevent-host-death family antitoxin [Bacteroidales bacterium]|jgi:prevent-host-death family protein|nr:type II toxin-antitoxin system prevent-host-death family antitoxin [Bacteroidales bacterium]
MSSVQIGVFEAKTHFSKVIDTVEKGDDFIVTRRGKPVAMIIPCGKEKKMTYNEAVIALRSMKKFYHGKPGDFNIRKAVEEGRR